MDYLRDELGRAMGYVHFGVYYTDTFSIPAAIQHLLDDEKVEWICTLQDGKRWTASYYDFETKGYRLLDRDQIGLHEDYWTWEYYC